MELKAGISAVEDHLDKCNVGETFIGCIKPRCSGFAGLPHFLGTPLFWLSFAGRAV
jgi:hypothetical protein